MQRSFLKMHGLGNDFVIFDARQEPLALTEAQIVHIADRRRGVGCDQVIMLEPTASARADAFMRIYNPDGSESSACGNATRCVASLLMQESGRDEACVATRAGVLYCTRAENGIAVDMGMPRTGWQEIPLAQEMDTLRLPLKENGLSDPVAVSMGNPHMVFFTTDIKDIALAELGPALEHHALFPERANVSVAEMTGPASIALRVWERGAGETLACGTAACATLVAAVRRGLISGRSAEVSLPGGILHIEWMESNAHVIMTGPVAQVFSGVVTV